jgi:hypothetical protein
VDPFGVHLNKALPDIPTAYLRWVLTSGVKLSAGLRAAVVAELQPRGQEPLPAPPRVLRPCPQCGTAGKIKLEWTTDSLQRRHLKAICATCGCFLDRPPQTPEYVEMANGSST